MSYRIYKFIIMPILQEVNDDGEVIQEVGPKEPTTVFGIAGVHKFADNFELELNANPPQVVKE